MLSSVMTLFSHDVSCFIQKRPLIKEYIDTSPTSHCQLIHSLIATGDGETIFRGLENKKQLTSLVESLMPAHQFFASMGGLLTYYQEVTDLIRTEKPPAKMEFEMPGWIDLSEETNEVKRAIYQGVSSLNEIAEIYPVGGAGDRLNLLDESTGEPLPAAQLQFAGKTLLEGLIRDLEAKELLFEKLFGKKLITPIVLMTSFEKHNHLHILDILERNHWFHRPKELVHLIEQPLVPVITEEGHFSMKGPLNPVLKPGGHGVLWKLCEERGAFEFLRKHQRKKGLIRQINNPIAGTDYGILAFCGIGMMKNKVFGFASCPRLVHAAEGMNVQASKKNESGVEVSLRNIEYTDFKKYGIKDVPVEEGCPYSKYPANTNILFVDLVEIERLSKEFPLPGKIINMKTHAPFIEADGTVRELPAGRLESMMQNISDHIVNFFPKNSDSSKKDLKSFLTYSQREKTISVTKKSYRPGQSIEETPEGAFYTMQQNYHALLKSCGIQMPFVAKEQEFLTVGPSVFFLFHPALGPLWSIIRQKIRGGQFSKGAELQLELDDVDIADLDLRGSFLVSGDMRSSSLRLKNVTIKNRGIDREAANHFSTNRVERKERLEILIEPNAEFIAENVTIEGDHQLVVPTGYRMRAVQEEGMCVFRLEKLTGPISRWKYSVDEAFNVVLNL